MPLGGSVPEFSVLSSAACYNRRGQLANLTAHVGAGAEHPVLETWIDCDRCALNVDRINTSRGKHVASHIIFNYLNYFERVVDC